MEERNLELTQDLKEKLKGTLGFQVETPFIYSPKAYRDNEIPKEFWPRFLLKSKNGLEIAEVEDNTGFMSYDSDRQESKLHLQSGSLRIDTLKRGILKVSGFMLENESVISWDSKTKDMTIIDKDGKSITKNNIKIEKIIALMKMQLQVELQNAINERSIMTEEELQGLEL